ncbi:MAG: LLM class F420-dependent oxidoreductase [Myxococcales bacterium]|nr:LLM class F420-dependent oxidoreductase [Myxococcales bacterium]
MLRYVDNYPEEDPVHFGIAIFPTEYSIQPGPLARAMEDRGFESLWVSEHSHIPLSRKTAWPGGADLPKHYYDTYDPFVALTAAATATRTLKVGTGICLVVQRDPIHTAKSVSSLDQISGGRFLFGVGGGWNEEEMSDHGTEFRSRWKLLRERIEAMKAIWTEDKPEYHGELVDFDPMVMSPKPVQKPHPPIHVGGSFPNGARRAIRYGNGWMPLGGRDSSIVKQLKDFRQLAQDAGRDPDDFELSIYYGSPEPKDLAAYRDAGVARVIFMMPSEDETSLLGRLDALASATQVGG